MMKDEAPYLLEWVAHHLAVGFTDILVYTNDCSDGTDEMLMRLEELGLAHHRRNDIPKGKKPQPSALKYAQQEPIVQDSDWVLVFDADEFLCINYGDGSLDGLISAAGNANGIVITWRIFGSGGVEDWSREPVTEQYGYAAPPDWNKGWGVKTLFKFDADFWKLGIHRPSIKAKHLETEFTDTVNWLNGSGLPMEDYFKFRGWRSIRRTVGYDWAQMNHYAVKSVDSYAVRKFRGNVNLKADKYNSDYWALQDRNEVPDNSILRYAQERAGIVTELLKDPELSRLHHAALDRVEERLSAFRETDEYAKLKLDLREASKTPIGQLEAKPPKARDPAKIAALMSAVEKKSVGRAKNNRRNPTLSESEGGYSPYVTGNIDRSTDLAVPMVKNHEIFIPADPRVFTIAALQDINDGKFERRAARHIGRLVSRDDRLLHVGAGVGFLCSLACRTYKGLVALAQEERRDLSRVAVEVAAANELDDSSRLKITDGPLFFMGSDTEDAGGFHALIRDFRPSVLIVEDKRISGKILANTHLEAASRILIPDSFLGNPSMTDQAYRGEMQSCGYAYVSGTERSGFLVFDRM